MTSPSLPPPQGFLVPISFAWHGSGPGTTRALCVLSILRLHFLTPHGAA